MAVGATPLPLRQSPSLDDSTTYGAAAGSLGHQGLRWIADSKTALTVKVEQPIALARDPSVQLLSARFALDGTPYAFDWVSVDLSRLFGPPASAQDLTPLARAVLRPGERLGPRAPVPRGNTQAAAYTIVGGRGEYARASVSQLTTDASRGPARPESELGRLLLHAVRWFAMLFLGLALFFGLAVRRKIDLVNGSLLGALSVLLAAPDLAQFAHGGPAGSIVLAVILFTGLWTLVIWSAGESLLRTSREGFTTSLDALRHGRLGPRAGRALLIGLGAGAGIAGFRLGVAALAVHLPGCWPQEASVGLPAPGTGGTMVQAVLQAALAALALGIGRSLATGRRATAAAVAVALVALPLPALHPWPLAVAAGIAVAVAFVELGRRAGLTALLAASLAAVLLPTAVFAAGHLDWLRGTFAAAAGGSAALLGLGLIGSARAAEVELGRMVPPAFVRRLEEERRVSYEMDLLTRMQVGLLPAEVPALDGWEIAARSLLATEAGGDLYDFIHEDGGGHLWIAAGDVAGHGYSCAIVQAMTVAALTSLVAPGCTPAGVLTQVDRVLRRGGSHRNFTTLALLRLDPATGEALLANAGHPYPLLLKPYSMLLAGGEVDEIALPGLPLGQGPRREYRDLAVTLLPGSVLVLGSDGLFEAADRRDEAYGFARPARLLRAVWRRPADAIVEALLADWRHHLGPEEPTDDTTIVVIKRRA